MVNKRSNTAGEILAMIFYSEWLCLSVLYCCTNGLVILNISSSSLSEEISDYLSADTRNSKGCTIKLVKIPLIKSKTMVTNGSLSQEFSLETELSSGGSIKSGKKEYLTGSKGLGYYIQAHVGTPPQSINFLIDTGSSIFALAAEPHHYIYRHFNSSLSSTYSSSGHEIRVPYVQGEWKGHLGRDVVRLPSLNATVETSLGFITESTHFFIYDGNWEGIWGLAYSELAKSSSLENNHKTFFDDLVDATGIENVFSLSLCDVQGSLTLGGADEQEYTGELLYVQVRQEWFYELVISDFKVDGKSLGLDCKEYNFDKVVIDSGTTCLHLPPTVFNQLVKILSDKVSTTVPKTFWNGSDVACVQDENLFYESLPDLTLSLFGISSTPQSNKSNAVELVVSPQFYIREVYSNGQMRFPPVKCFRFYISASQSGCVVGAVIMEAFHTVFDRKNKRIGFAESLCKGKSRSGVRESVTEKNIGDCAYFRAEDKRKLTVTFVAISVLFFSMFFLVFAAFTLRNEFCLGPSSASEIQEKSPSSTRHLSLSPNTIKP